MRTAGSNPDAGSSETPLVTKLGIKEGTTLALVGAPVGVLAELPPRVRVKRQARGPADVVVAFFIRRVELERRFDALATMVFPSGGLWVAWPKRSSGIETDITDNVAREVGLPKGLVDNKVCAVDATWTGLRFVWRRRRRGAGQP
jgi:hypothetical protein